MTYIEGTKGRRKWWEQWAKRIWTAIQTSLIERSFRVNTNDLKEIRNGEIMKGMNDLRTNSGCPQVYFRAQSPWTRRMPPQSHRTWGIKKAMRRRSQDSHFEFWRYDWRDVRRVQRIYNPGKNLCCVVRVSDNRSLVPHSCQLPPRTAFPYYTVIYKVFNMYIHWINMLS